MSAGRPLVEVRDLCKHFPVGGGATVHAVENVSLHIGRGETPGWRVGRHRHSHDDPAHGDERPGRTGGRISVWVTALRAHRAKMQIIFQDPFASLDPRRPVGRAVAEPLRIHKIASGPDADERVAELFTKVGLEPDMMRQFPHQFSGGQRQRVCIARALASRPELVIADEAVSALDVSIQAQVINLMMELQSELGLSYLFISHDLAVVERMSHRVAVMYLGQIVEIGPRSAIFENPQHSYTQRLLDAVPIADPRARRDRPLLTDEIPSPVWAAGTAPELVELREVAPGHLVAVEH